MITQGQQKVLAFVRQHFEAHGRTPTLAEIGAHFGYTEIAAWKHVQGLIAAGELARSGRGGLSIPGTVILTGVATGALRAELARRDVKPTQGARA